MFSLRRMSSMLRNTNAKQGSKSKAGEYKLDASRWENRKLYYKNFRIKRKIRWWIPIDGVAFVFLWWRRAKNERRTGVLALRLWRGNQRRVTLYYISDLSFYTFWECAWNIFERIREAWGEGNWEPAMHPSAACCDPPTNKPSFLNLLSHSSLTRFLGCSS